MGFEHLHKSRELHNPGGKKGECSDPFKNLILTSGLGWEGGEKDPMCVYLGAGGEGCGNREDLRRSMPAGRVETQRVHR